MAGNVAYRISNNIAKYSEHNEVKAQVSKAKGNKVKNTHELVNGIISGKKPQVKY